MQSVPVGNFIMIGMLTVLMIQDIRTKRVSIWAIALFFISVAVAVIVRGQQADLYPVAGGLIGSVIIGVSIITKQSVGLADGLVITGLGVYMGLWKIIGLLMLALLFAALVAMVALLLKKADKNTKIPFIPFVQVAFVVMILGVV